MNPEYVSSLANHLWQSTLFAGLAGLLTLPLRNNHARVRLNVEKGAPPGEVPKSMVGNDALDTLLATLPQELGLKLEAQKAPLEILVIDHAEKVPTSN